MDLIQLTTRCSKRIALQNIATDYMQENTDFANAIHQEVPEIM